MEGLASRWPHSEAAPSSGDDDNVDGGGRPRGVGGGASEALERVELLDSTSLPPFSASASENSGRTTLHFFPARPPISVHENPVRPLNSHQVYHLPIELN